VGQKDARPSAFPLSNRTYSFLYLLGVHVLNLFKLIPDVKRMPAAIDANRSGRIENPWLL
jgi:hypothetical protein